MGESEEGGKKFFVINMKKQELKRLCILCGAGASYGCGSGAPLNLASDGCPPLANQVFAEKYESMLTSYPALPGRTDEIRTRINNKKI